MGNEILFFGIALKDWLTIVAILSAPWVALFIQKKLEAIKETRNRKLHIFRILMATRATPLSPEHVRALNEIDIEFYGNNKKYRSVRNAWRKYLYIRTEYTKKDQKTEADNVQFGKDLDETLTNLLLKMGEVLGYDFDETHIRQSVYRPQEHATEEQYQLVMRTNFIKLFSGEISLPVNVINLPVEPSITDDYKKLK